MIRLFKFALLNLMGLALVVAAEIQGWLAMIYIGDPTGLSDLIVFVFLIGLMVCGEKIYSISIRRHRAKVIDVYLKVVADRSAGSRAISADAMRAKSAASIVVVRQFANSLVILGMIGTVVGFVMALASIDADVVRDVSQISGMVGNLLTGMSVALYTTLVGAVLSLWLTVNYNLLATGVRELVHEAIAAGEREAKG